MRDKGHFDNLGLHSSGAYSELQRAACLREGAGNVGHGNVGLEAGAGAARGDPAHLLSRLSHHDCPSA